MVIETITSLIALRSNKQMTDQTKAAAYRLLAALSTDSDALADMPIYGDWMTHLED
ncbi:hypothetical protein Syn8016DRAFT_1117 [Synechococcus sp. WH 8016]|nr:hypothetical protein Syn8016DRAFT_1117 [Synechococcus sp. WH 8016]